MVTVETVDARISGDLTSSVTERRRYVLLSEFAGIAAPVHAIVSVPSDYSRSSARIAFLRKTIRSLTTLDVRSLLASRMLMSPRSCSESQPRTMT